MVVFREPFGGFLLSLTADFANHDDSMCLGVFYKPFKNVDEISSVEGVTSDAHNCGLAKTYGGGLIDCLISEGARSRDDTNIALGVDVAGHDTYLALAWLDDAWAIRADQASLGLLL